MAVYNKHAEQLSVRGEFPLLISYDGNCKTRCCSIEKAKSFVFSYHLIGYNKQIKTLIVTDPFQDGTFLSSVPRNSRFLLGRGRTGSWSKESRRMTHSHPKRSPSAQQTLGVGPDTVSTVLGKELEKIRQKSWLSFCQEGQVRAAYKADKPAAFKTIVPWAAPELVPYMRYQWRMLSRTVCPVPLSGRA